MDMKEELADEPDEMSDYSDCDSTTDMKSNDKECDNSVSGILKASKDSVASRTANDVISCKSTDDGQDESKKYQCEVCGLRLSSRVSRKHHIITKHIQEKNFKCEECGKCFYIPKSLKNHQLVHKAVKDHHCPICQKQIAHKSSLEVHIKRVHKMSREKLLPCPICDKKMRDKHSLKCHLSAVHTDKTVKCLEPGCPKMFPNESYMRSHYRSHLDEKPHECGVCGQRFKTKSYMEKHQRSHSGLRPHQCLDCGRSYLTVSHLNAHAKVHTGERPYQCTECGKCFRLKRHLVYHANLHSGNKPFECTICGYRTGFKSNWYAHRKRHVGSKNFECYICQKPFFDRQSLLKHLESHQRRSEREARSKEAASTSKRMVRIERKEPVATTAPDCVAWEDYEEPVGQLVQLVGPDGKTVSNLVLLPGSELTPLLPDVFVSLDVSGGVLDITPPEAETDFGRPVRVSDQSLAEVGLVEEAMSDDDLDGVRVGLGTTVSQVEVGAEVPVALGCDQCSNTFVLLEDLSEHLQTFHGLDVEGCSK